MESIPYDKITSIKVERGMFTSTLVIRFPGLSELTRLGQRTGFLAWGRGKEGSIDAIPKDKAEQLLKVVWKEWRELKHQKLLLTISIADEIRKLAELKDLAY